MSALATSAIARTAARVRTSRLARVATEMFAPAAVVATLLALLGWHSSGYRLKGLLVGVVAGVFESLIPFGYIVHQVRAGRVTDHHIGLREQRRGPLVFALGSAVVGLALMLLLGAPRDLVAAVVAGGVGLIVAIVVSHWWKMSIHGAVAAGACVIFTQVAGPVGAAAVPLVALVGWSRVALGDHTRAQVIVGTLVGAVVAGTVFGLLR